MASLASLEELEARLDQDLDAKQKTMAQAALDDASELARHYGGQREDRPLWPTRSAAPRLVRTLVLRACMRYMHNPDGLITSRAGDETMAYSDRRGAENYGTVYFTEGEQELLAELGGDPSKRLITAGLVAYGTVDNWECYTEKRPRHREGWVPTGYGGKPFPLYNHDEHPW